MNIENQLNGGGVHGGYGAQDRNDAPTTILESGGQAFVEAHAIDAADSTLSEVTGQQKDGTKGVFAGTSTLLTDGGRPVSETQSPDAPISHPSSQDVGHQFVEAQQANASALAPTCDLLRELHRQRQDLHRAEKSLTLQIKAKLRRMAAGDKGEAEKVYKSMLNGCAHDMALESLAVCTPFITARQVLEKERKATEKQMEKQAKALPVYAWVEQVRGFGALGLAQIVGEAGNLSNYATVSKLWKRLGLAVINGERQQRKPGAESLEHGYSPARRSVVWTMGDSLFRAGGEYAEVCRARKEREREKAAAEGLTVAPAAKIPAAKRDQYRSDGHVHNRAKRYMEKRLVRDLWAAWRRY